MNNLLIFGAGEHGMVAKETAESMNFFDKIDFLDDNISFAIGKFEEYKNFINEYQYAFVALGNNNLRMDWINKLETASFTLVNLIHKSAIVSPSVILESGIIIEAGAVINTNSKVSKGVIISIGALIDHNVKIESGCHIRAGSVIKPNTDISENVVIKENSSI